MAAYGAQLERRQGRRTQASSYIDALFKNVPVQPASGREALADLRGRQGRRAPLLRERGDRRAGRRRGHRLRRSRTSTILIQNPIAVVNTTENPQTAQAFLDFVHSRRRRRRSSASNGYRPTRPDGRRQQFDFPTPPGLFTIDDLGGWATVKKEFFDPENGSVDEDLRGPGYCHRASSTDRAVRPRARSPRTERGAPAPRSAWAWPCST